MKRTLLLYLCFTLCATLSCEKEMSVLDNEQQEIIHMTKAPATEDFHVSMEMAEMFVSSFFEDEWKSFPYVEKNDTLWYVFNFKDGWKAISSDMRTNPVIAESLTGYYPMKVEDGPLYIWQNEMADAMNALRNSEYKDPKHDDTVLMWQSFRSVVQNKWKEKISQKKTRSSDDGFHWVKVIQSTSHSRNVNENINHLIPTKWGQGEPWNQKTPTYREFLSQIHTPVGCVAVAYGQIIYYIFDTTADKVGLCENINSYNYTNFPTLNYKLTLGELNYNSTRWIVMKERRDEPGMASYVADLLAQIGKQVSMMYNTNSSTANTNSYTLHCAGLNSVQSQYSFANVHSVLQNGQPLIISAGGHCWIIDGYLSYTDYNSCTYAYYYVESTEGLNGEYNGYHIESIYTDEEMDAIFPEHLNGSTQTFTSTQNVNGLLMNWGWEGEHDDAVFSIENNADWLGFNNNKQIFHTFSLIN